jgi:predicted MFS family arabinose efflux permease
MDKTLQELLPHATGKYCMFRSLNRPDILIITLAAAGIMAVTMGARQSLGLFIAPIETSTGISIATISLALAIGQFTWGAIQPIAGVVADLFGSRIVLIGGLLLLALGSAISPFMNSGFGMIISLGLLSAIGAGAGSVSVLMGAAAQRLPIEARGSASGVINAGGSFGQFVFAPIMQKLLQSTGWMGAMWAMAVMALAALPLVGKLTSPVELAVKHKAEDSGITKAIGTAMKNPSYLLLHAGFFTCGFHVAFLVTHLPGEVNLCGLPPSVASWSIALIGLANIFGSLYAGSCISKYRSKYILAAMYGSRVLLIGLYLLMPRTELTFYLFAAGLGFTWLATVPPTVAIVGKLFGIRYLTTLFSFTVLTHQVGGFFGAYLGGLVITRFGDYGWMWYADMALAATAAVINLPIQEAPVAASLSPG